MPFGFFALTAVVEKIEKIPVPARQSFLLVNTKQLKNLLANFWIKLRNLYIYTLVPYGVKILQTKVIHI